jgi:hypothetical protein
MIGNMTNDIVVIHENGVRECRTGEWGGGKVPNNILGANYYFIYKKMVILHTTTW